MNGDPLSHGLWEQTAPAAPPAPKLEVDIDCDVAIVGAGYTGLSAALHAAEGGATVAVLDGAEIGFGGSGRNVGLVNAGMWVMPDELPKTLGDTYGQRLLRLLGDAPRVVFELVDKHKIACEIERVGTLHCAVDRSGFAELKERERQWRARGAPVRLLDKAEAAAKIGANAYAGALLDERAGTIQPLAYARGLAGAAIAAGARVFSSSPVARLPRRRRPLDPAHAAGRGAGEMGPRRHQRLHGRAVGRAAGGADPSALFQLRHRPARRGDPARDPAGAARLLGHPPGVELVPLRPGRPAGVRQRRRAARNRPADPPRLGAPRRSPSCSRGSPASNSRANGTA